MRIIVINLLLFISTLTFSQEKLLGNYCSIPIGESGVICIDFKENNRFYYQVSDCLGITHIGNGKFKLKDENLNLIFDKAEQSLKSKIKITESQSKSKEKINLKFLIVDENEFEIPANIIRTSHTEHFLFDEFKKAYIVDKNSPKTKYKIEFIGYETIEIEIDHKSDKLIHIKLFPVQTKIISDKEINLEWIKLNEDEFKSGQNTTDIFKRKT